jgi:hypothetical protein
MAETNMFPATMVPGDLASTPATSMVATKTSLEGMLNLIERIFVYGFCHADSLAIHGCIHQDRAGRIPIAAIAGAVGARPIKNFQEDLNRLDLLQDNDAKSEKIRLPAFTVVYSDNEAVVSRTARPENPIASEKLRHGRCSSRECSPGASSASSRHSDTSRAPLWSRENSPASQDVYWPSRGDVICICSKEGTQVPCIRCPEDPNDPCQEHFSVSQQRETMQYAQRHFSAPWSGTNLDGRTLGPDGQPQPCAAVSKALQSTGHPWNSTPCTLMLHDMPGVDAHGNDVVTRVYGIGVSNDKVLREHAALTALISSAHVRTGLEDIPEACRRLAAFMKANPNCMVPHPDRDRRFDKHLVPIREARYGPRFGEAPEVMKRKSDSPQEHTPDGVQPLSQLQQIEHRHQLAVLLADQERDHALHEAGAITGYELMHRQGIGDPSDPGSEDGDTRGLQHDGLPTWCQSSTDSEKGLAASSPALAPGNIGPDQVSS